MLAQFAQHDLADAVGATREAVAKSLRLLRTAGVVRTRPRRIELIDHDALRLLAAAWKHRVLGPRARSPTTAGAAPAPTADLLDGRRHHSRPHCAPSRRPTAPLPPLRTSSDDGSAPPTPPLAGTLP
ncbi:helix-turn-helix domain-containing protein [Streptomyces thermocarboxydus]